MITLNLQTLISNRKTNFRNLFLTLWPHYRTRLTIQNIYVFQIEYRDLRDDTIGVQSGNVLLVR